MSDPLTVSVDDPDGLIMPGFAVADEGLIGVAITATCMETHDVELHVPCART